MREQELCMSWTGSAEEEKTNLLLYKMYRASSQNITFGCRRIWNLHSVPHIRPQTKVMICFLFRRLVLKNSKWFSYFRINRFYSHYNPFLCVSLMVYRCVVNLQGWAVCLTQKGEKILLWVLKFTQTCSQVIVLKRVIPDFVQSLMVNDDQSPLEVELVGSTLYFWIFPAVHSDKNCIFIVIEREEKEYLGRWDWLCVMGWGAMAGMTLVLDAPTSSLVL